MISQTYISRISILKEKEENALLENEAYRKQIELLKTDISQLRSIQSRHSQPQPVKERPSEIIRKQIALPTPVLNDSASEKASAHSSRSETRKSEKRQAFKSASKKGAKQFFHHHFYYCLLYTSPSPRDLSTSRMPSSA
eukprot:TRINITY_DN10074_c0_g1_i1.p2 TRINITY_DN10074_c0_g1~~TRINITY_DN10074_c0_g1_i1.p2  ORF type:complete len:139 (-),score=22.49 TRINITY_DN10074_c0_g1_i1:113-529(-)